MGILATHLLAVSRRTRPEAEYDSPETYAEVRHIIDAMMGRYLRRVQKSIWCDEAPANLGYVELLATLFPEARYICLYRNCLDTAQSCIEPSRWGAMRELRPYVSRHPGNTPLAMVENWLDKTGWLLEFEAKNSSSCVRIRYEDLVKRPQDETKRLMTFLKLPWCSSLVEHSLTVPHYPGGGDPKIRAEDSIHTRSVGKGRVIPATFFRRPSCAG